MLPAQAVEDLLPLAVEIHDLPWQQLAANLIAWIHCLEPALRQQVCQAAYDMQFQGLPRAQESQPSSSKA